MQVSVCPGLAHRSIMAHWVAFYTKPHKEYAVRDFLAERKIEVYLPEVRTRTRRAGRRGMRPFFPHYLFARLDLEDGAMAQVRWIPGLRRIVSFGDKPAPVPDEVVAHIRHRLAAMKEAEPAGPFNKGDAVRVLRGPFEGLDAIFDRHLSPEGRVRILLDIMGRLVATELDVDDLLPPY